MDAFELYNEKHEPTGVWCCGKCRKLVLSPVWHFGSSSERSTREGAEQCCRPRICECGKPTDYETSSQCSECRSVAWRREQAERLAKTLAAAEDVTGTYDGPVCIEGGHNGEWGEGFSSSPHAAAEYLEDDDTADEFESEVWAFACTSEVRAIDIGDAIERVCEDGYEDMGSDLVVPQYLQEAVDRFNKENEKRLTVWNVDSKRKVLIRPQVPAT
jgi:hypothetical protein